MTLSEVKQHLEKLETLIFKRPDGTIVPDHFHVTEIGETTKKFIDCGGTLREEKTVNFQLWNADDVDHRLQPKKLRNIIKLAERQLSIDDTLEVKVEYQGDTIGIYDLAFDGEFFHLKSTLTDCLAKDKCGISEPELKPESQKQCDPNSGCC
ncbi:MAG: DUF6428 family protein [Psychroflexus sp.]|nr:DUF6428 family protein [Psychroflexus sp.]